MIKNIFFDFDGVIADSVNVKTDAFAKLYEFYGREISQKVMEHHKANGGMSRFEKFRLYHKNYLGIELSDLGVDELADRFSKLVKLGVIESPEVLGSHAFLKRNKNNYNMYIITGTPTEESIEICKARGIYNCFKGIYGSPQKKEFWCNYIINQNNLLSEETVFVGDALADYNAAIASNLKFYLRDYYENHELFQNINNIIKFKNFYDFEKLIIK